MGCLLGCFGLSSSKRKRRRQAARVLSGAEVRRLCHYEALKSDPAELDVGVEELRKTTKETLNSKIRKKVRFNLNVQTYEPIPREEIADCLWGDDEDENNEKVWGANSEECRVPSDSSGEPTTSEKIVLYPPNHRYRNYIDSCDDEDAIVNYESDLDDYYEEDEDDMGSDPDDLRESEEEFSEQDENSLPANLQTGASFGQDRSPSVYSVLKPVENIAQWKAAKAKGIPTPITKQQQSKENTLTQKESGNMLPAYASKTKHAIQDVAITASLSNWLVFADQNEPLGTSYAKGCRLDRTSSLLNSNDNPILDLW